MCSHFTPLSQGGFDMNTKLATKEIRLNEWAGIIKSCRASGLKVDDYCRQYDISRDAYYYWLRKVKEKALLQAGFVEVPVMEQRQPGTIFDTSMVIKTGNTELCINDDTSSELISRVLGVMGYA